MRAVIALSALVLTACVSVAVHTGYPSAVRIVVGNGWGTGGEALMVRPPECARL